MPGVLALEGVQDRGECKCTKNGRTMCRVAKTKKHPSGWTFVSASDPRARQCGRR